MPQDDEAFKKALLFNCWGSIRTTIESFDLALRLINSSGELDRTICKLALERCIADIHQLVTYFTRKLGLGIPDSTQPSVDRIRLARTALFHVHSDATAINKAMEIRGHFNILHPNSKFLKTGDLEISNDDPSDIKIMYGKEYVWLEKDILNILNAVISQHDSLVSDHKKIGCVEYKRVLAGLQKAKSS